VDYWAGTAYAGGQEVTIQAPLGGSGPPVFARAGAIVPLAPAYDSLVAADPSSGLTTWSGDLLVRIMPSGPSGPSESTFTLYDGTQLHWTGSALEVSANPSPRTIELQTSDGKVTSQRVDSATASIA
jgi:alpha-glucosidase (family GH31 glycosyl hydrolase)